MIPSKAGTFMDQLLRQTELFQDFPVEIITQDILPHCKILEYSKGQVLIEPHQKVDWFGIVASGRIHLTHLFPDGSVGLISPLSSPETLGFDLICTRSQLSPYHATAAVSGQLLKFPAELLLSSGLLREEYRQKALLHLLMLISHHNMKKEYRLAILSQKGLRERIMTYLLMQSDKRQTSTFQIPFSREEMAAFLCVNRSALSHELSQMEQEGMIHFHKNTFTLLCENWKNKNTY